MSEYDLGNYVPTFRRWAFPIACVIALAAAWMFVRAVYDPRPKADPVAEELGRQNQAPPPVLTEPLANRALIISIDGLRPDLALRGDTPNIHALFARGSYSFWARTTAMSVTLPSHTSMVTGVVPRKHGVTWNGGFNGYPKYPTIFELAKKHRPELTTAVVAGKAKFLAFTKPGTVDHAYVPVTDDVDDLGVANAAAGLIIRDKPNVMFVHFANVDQTGHYRGWGTPLQMAAIAHADRCTGIVLDALDAAKLTDSTLVILTADHGGQGRSHGPDDARSRHIPWIVAGPHVKENFDLTTDSSLVINTEDSMATACYFLGIPIAPNVDGRPVKQIIEDRELMLEEPSPSP